MTAADMSIDGPAGVLDTGGIRAVTWPERPGRAADRARGRVARTPKLAGMATDNGHVRQVWEERAVTVAAPPAWESMPALMYHSVSAVGGPLSDLAVPRSRLAQQLGALTEAGYRLVGLSEALDELERGSTDKLI